MKKKIKHWLLTLLVINSLNLLGQKSDSLTFRKGYEKHITLQDFINEISFNDKFKIKLRDSVLAKYDKQKTLDNFFPKNDDEKIKLVFSSQKTKNLLKVGKVSIETILKELEKNPIFKDSLLARFTPINKKKGGKEVVKDGKNLVKEKIETFNLEKNKLAKEEVTKELTKDNFILNYSWIIIFLGIILFAFGWFLREFLLNKRLFKFLNSSFFPNESKKLKRRTDIVHLLQVKTVNTSPNDSEERIWKIEKGKLENNLKNSEGQLNEWLKLANGKSIEEIKVFFEEKELFDNYTQEDKIQPPIDTNLEVYYFSSVNRDGDLGIFQDDNKSITKESDSLYKFEINKSNPNEAKFWFDASNSSYALSYRSYMIDPFCVSLTSFFEGCSRITHVEKGTAILKDGRWIVEVGNKAKIRYV